ncbi:MAG TPA: DUF1801 domain-containing protein [Gemmatimonadota bacterium]|nr:DUF1801 domain-containing protein [Gemmatimonadota bacterium]
MKREAAGAATVDEYVAAFPPKVRKILQAIRKTIRSVEPEFEEAIRYGIPTFQLDGKNVVHFAGHAKHTAVYPAPRAAPELAAELARYGGGKGTVQFPLDSPVPHDLIRRIVEFRVREHRAKRPPRRR